MIKDYIDCVYVKTNNNNDEKKKKEDKYKNKYNKEIY